MSSRFPTAQRPTQNSLFAAYPSSSAAGNKRPSSASPSPSSLPRANGHSYGPAPRPNSSQAYPGSSPYDSNPYGPDPGGAGTFGAYPGRSSYAAAEGGEGGVPGAGRSYGSGSASGSASNRGHGERSSAGYEVTGVGESEAGGYRSATPNSRGQYSDAVLSELESQNDEQLEGMSKRVRMLKDITLSIGDEIRSSTALAEKMNDSFDNTRVRLRGTMNRMLRMAKRTGVGWKVWLAFIGAVAFLFWYVWLF